jgi:hypothetical protein|tara:strand:- start:1451 stop:1714 length:264 start_codon:yes stop_codon:yes gene_type:complete
MFVLTDNKSGGVYAVRDDEAMERVVQLFVDKDDAERYYIMLKADEYPRDLSVQEVDEATVKENCRQYGYRFAIIDVDEFVIPPPQDK